MFLNQSNYWNRQTRCKRSNHLQVMETAALVCTHSKIFDPVRHVPVVEFPMLKVPNDLGVLKRLNPSWNERGLLRNFFL